MGTLLATPRLDQAFEAVCRNERFAAYRDMEDDLYAVAEALLSGWRPDTTGLEGLSAARGGYLIDLLRGWMSPKLAAAWDTPLEALAMRRYGPPAPFFHADPANSPCHDDLAQRWGLSRGLNVSRLLQSLEAPAV